MKVVLGIETSCDETAAAVVVDGREVRSSVVSSQIELHARYGGVVPEIAGRAHVSLITPVITEALELAGLRPRGVVRPGEHRSTAVEHSPNDAAGSNHAGSGIDLVAATIGPGLIGSLLVGVSAAKALALVWGVPFIGVNHLEAHLLSPFLENPDLELPLVTLLVSGGHTLIVHMESATAYTVLGSTIDDAAGEAFDKVARYLGLPYPGGPVIDALARTGDPQSIRFPRAMRNEAYDFSFSGLKTSVVNYVRKHPDVDSADVAASFQEAVVDVLVAKLGRAAVHLGAKGIAIGGGVAANSALRERVGALGRRLDVPTYLPDRAMCTDNAAMVAGAAWWRHPVDGDTGLDAPAWPSLRLRR